MPQCRRRGVESRASVYTDEQREAIVSSHCYSWGDHVNREEFLSKKNGEKEGNSTAQEAKNWALFSLPTEDITWVLLSVLSPEWPW